VRGRGTVHTRLELVARTAPTSLAVSDALESLTFAELDSRANALAWRLRDFGVRRGVLVGLCHERSAANVAAALAILKAGGAYIGLDPSYPAARIEYVLRDAQVPVLVAQAGVRERLPALPCEVIELEKGTSSLGERIEPPDDLVGPADVAYAIYTSGSTGEPKGVLVSHASLTGLIDWHCAAFGLTAADRGSVLASTAFDASVWEIWPSLAAGASVHVPDQGVPTIPAALRDWLVATGVTVSFVVTPLAEALLDLEWPRGVPLRIILTGGDVLHRRPPPGMPFSLVNNYGVTEATVVSTSGAVACDDGSAGLPSIGRAIPGARLHVLDSEGREVPSGEAGELYIGGPSVAIGYLNRPGLTAERFLPDPFTVDAAARMYRTGDSVRITPDGDVAFLGRLDEQIKILGHRIEPEEISAALATHPAVRACAVVARENGVGQLQLIAYVVPSMGPLPARQALRHHLAMRLPAYMLPAIFVEMEALPVNTNGKLDRSALPAPERRTVDCTAVGLTPTEVALAEIVLDLLEIDAFRRDENFFELGGHSLMAAQLVARILERFGVELALLDIFDNPTVADMAHVVEDAAAELVASLSDDEVERLMSTSGTTE
jgi:amino acid adenylation domain-containing protein